MSDAAPADRVRTLLLRADNMLKNAPDATRAGADADRIRRAREALTSALEVAADPAVDPRLRELVQRRLDGLDGLERDGDVRDA
jgi:hypothetical protein